MNNEFVFRTLTTEEHIIQVKESFKKLGIDTYYKDENGELKLKSLEDLFNDILEKWEEL